MSNSSNQSGILALLAVVLAAIVYATMFFGSELEQKNLTSSYGTIALPASELSSTKAKLTNDRYAATESRSDLSGITLPSYNKEKNTSTNYSEPSETAFPTSGVTPIDVQMQSSRKQNTASLHFNGSNFRNQLVASSLVANTNVQYVITNQNPSNPDINASFMLIQANNAQTAAKAQQGSKRVIQTSASSSSSTDMNGKQKSKNAPPTNPGEPGASLPVGDGVWMMLMFASVYSLISLMTIQLQLKGKEIK